MKDQDIRPVLIDKLLREHKNCKDTRLIEELGLCQGDARIDIAVVNGTLHGYEIKSEKDTLVRLDKQQEIYNKTLSYVTIVASDKHLNNISNQVPEWWGIDKAIQSASTIKIKKVRKPKKNPSIDSHSLVQLLWRDEALDLLKELGLSKGMNKKPRKLIWNKLVENMTGNKLEKIIHKTIKLREGWREN